MPPRLLSAMLDFALPARCPGCGAVVDGNGRFCTACWQALDWVAGGGCACCGDGRDGMTPGMLCAACLADPPAFDRLHAAVRYGPVAAHVATSLKYGRKTGAARVMATALSRHVAAADRPLIVPVPLHRWRLWQRGFNQSAMVAARIARETGTGHVPGLLVRTRATPVLRGLGRAARDRALRGAIAIAPAHREAVRGRVVLLVDDVFTTGATAGACARALKRGGAARVELLCWARVDPGRRDGEPA